MADNAGQNGQAQDDLQGTDATEDRADAEAVASKKNNHTYYNPSTLLFA